MDEKSVMAKIVSSLLPEYAAFKRTWDMMPNDFKKMDLLLSNLKREEMSLKKNNVPGEALFVKGKQSKGHNFNRNKVDKKKPFKCYWCGKDDHMWRACL